MPDEVNAFYSRFENTVEGQAGQPMMPSWPCTMSPSFKIEEYEVRNLLQRQNSRKAAGPDSISSATLKWCAFILAPVLTDIFNWSLRVCRVPACFKAAVIIPVPKKSNISCLDDYRPVALTSVAMKIFERLVLRYLISKICLDSHQFAYKANRSVDDAVALCIHSILQHLEAPNTYVRVLFLDYKSAFNTIIPVKLFDKLKQLGIQHSLAFWILDFLQNRTQVVKINDILSSRKTISVGAPQGCVLSPLLYSIYTNDCVSHCNTVQIFKFADDTTLIGLITNDNESDYRREVSTLFDWSCTHNLKLNVLKTKEMVFDFRRRTNVVLPVTIDGQDIENVQCFKFLGTTISATLKWDDNLRGIIKKSHQRLFFLRQLKKFGISKVGMFNFYRAVIESVLTFSLIVWFGSSTAQQRSQINNITRVASKIIGYDLPTIDEIYVSRLQEKGLKILKDPLHPARHLFTPLPSGRRLRAIKTKSTRFLNSTYCRIVHALNSSGVYASVFHSL